MVLSNILETSRILNKHYIQIHYYFLSFHVIKYKKCIKNIIKLHYYINPQLI